jgi:hypothetical protein
MTDFNPGPGNLSLYASNTDAYIQKVDSNGNLIWAKKFGGSSYDKGIGIALDNSGNIYTTGYYIGNISSPVLTGYGNRDIYVLKLDPSGNVLWAKSFGGKNQDEGNSIAVNSLGEVYVTGYFRDTIDADPNGGVVPLYGNGNDELFLIKLDANGNYLWSEVIGGYGSDIGYDLFIDAADNVYLTGKFSGTVDFDPGAGVYNLSTDGNGSAFVQKLDVNGNLIWALGFGSARMDYGESITVDNSGNVIVTGSFLYGAFGTVDFDPGPGTYNQSNVGSADMFVSKFDSNGNFLWSGTMGTTLVDYGREVTVDNSGNIYLLVGIYGNVDADIGPGTNMINSQGIIIEKLSPAGNLQWVATVGGSGYSYGLAANNYAVYSTGGFNGIKDFDPTAGVYNLTSLGSYDAFVLKLGNPSTLPIELLSFDATPVNNQVKTYWTTATEINNDYFTVERSKDAIHFEKVGVVQGAGNSNQILDYELYDDDPLSGVSYYRLKQTDFDGKFSFSNIVAVNFINNVDDISILSIPGSNQIKIIGLKSKTYEIRIFNAIGQEVTQPIQNSNIINTSSLENGVYFIKVIDYKQNTIKTIKWVKN